ncbi:unnamed protein product [Rotaria sp. Silwood1]|nr:unnamed protein product [Rotaria sp. Silwood1]
MMAFNILKQLEEPETKSLDEHIINCIKRAAHQSLKMNKNKIIMNINPNELSALGSLMKDKTIVIMKADKGSSYIIMDNEQYIIKDSFIFAKLIQQQKPQRNDIMLSLDAESLFINTPVHEAINLAI